MKYVDELRDGATARRLAAAIAAEADPDRGYRFMEFCGGHTHAVFRYGVPDLLPPNVHLIHGPGCPVCVLPVGRVDAAIELARRPEVILCTYGDLLRVPGSRRSSLLRARAEGADVRMVYSPADSLRIAREHPDREVVFFAIGFETTTPPTAVVVRRAEAEGLANFSVVSNHVLTPPAMAHLLDSPELDGPAAPSLDGFIGPSHVSTIIGSAPYEPFAREHGRPVVIAGFEPLDVMQAIRMLIRQVNAGRAEVENEYTRAVTRVGNRKAQELVSAVFAVRESFEWRGMGSVPGSGLEVRPEYAHLDAERRFGVAVGQPRENRACICPSVLRGAARPTECTLFGTTCTPDHPMGSCMVSSEGACAAHYAYGRTRERAEA
ncbi:hydrogenase formation protein HupD [Thiohalorhabdus denitrificans]|uniref:Hydrogenase maturation factor n=1 Tax=Thiohalorhabdus denitrificans TaxID=381306 RepID=A0A0P9GIZ4_9GAMM|nr:hydrogenase formation protein HypD [Thiohalorhabdus denitrificans]KPV40003.1 hydrogenase formation protein HupD [Thiohalorhabdus denitrificans]SCY11744.1 hydrogenase expression/formation protein HypD [Thiohalorhabdus denitrificans]